MRLVVWRKQREMKAFLCSCSPSVLNDSGGNDFLSIGSYSFVKMFGSGQNAMARAFYASAMCNALDLDTPFELELGKFIRICICIGGVYGDVRKRM